MLPLNRALVAQAGTALLLGVFASSCAENSDQRPATVASDAVIASIQTESNESAAPFESPVGVNLIDIRIPPSAGRVPCSGQPCTLTLELENVSSRDVRAIRGYLALADAFRPLAAFEFDNTRGLSAGATETAVYQWQSQALQDRAWEAAAARISAAGADELVLSWHPAAVIFADGSEDGPGELAAIWELPAGIDRSFTIYRLD